jgi:OTU-like cysteine protease
MRVLLPWNKARKEGEDADDPSYGSDSDSDSDGDSSAGDSSSSSFASSPSPPSSPRALPSPNHRRAEGDACIGNERASALVAAAAETTAAAAAAAAVSVWHRSSPAAFLSTPRKKRGIDQLSGSLHRLASTPNTDDKKPRPADPPGSPPPPQQQLQHQPIPKPAARRRSTPEVSGVQSSSSLDPPAEARGNDGTSSSLDSKPAAKPTAAVAAQRTSCSPAAAMTAGRGRDLPPPQQQPNRYGSREPRAVRAHGNRDGSSSSSEGGNDDEITAEVRPSPAYRSNEQEGQEEEEEDENPAASSSPLYENAPPPSPRAHVRFIGTAKTGESAAIVLATHNSSSHSHSYASTAMMASSPSPNIQDGMPPAHPGGAQQRSADPAPFEEYDDDVRDGDGGGLNEMEEAFVKGLKSRGLDVVEQEGDGNCLFRAVALQVYGDAEAHADVRSLVCDFMAKDPAHFGQFVDGETFEEYVARKRLDGVHGNNPELQAVCELFNRPIEVYTPESGHLKPINTFQDQYKTGDIPIRLAYHDGNHYNAVINPLEPTAGLGLGLPGLRPGLADQLQLSRAKAESDAVQDEAELHRAVQESALEYGRTAADDFQRALKESAFSMDHVRNRRNRGASFCGVFFVLPPPHANAVPSTAPSV